MATQPSEIVTGQDLVGMLQAWIDSRRMGEMEIMQTPFSWVTILLGIQKEGNSEFLLVEPVPQFESFLSRSPGQEVSFEFLENGILCKFRSRVIRCQPQAIWLALPSSIQRIQKREHFRIFPPQKRRLFSESPGRRRRPG